MSDIVKCLSSQRCQLTNSILHHSLCLHIMEISPEIDQISDGFTGDVSPSRKWGQGSHSPAPDEN